MTTTNNTHYEIIFRNKEDNQTFKQPFSTLEDTELAVNDLISEGCRILGTYVITTQTTVSKLIVD